jgi:cyclin B
MLEEENREVYHTESLSEHTKLRKTSTRVSALSKIFSDQSPLEDEEYSDPDLFESSDDEKDRIKNGNTVTTDRLILQQAMRDEAAMPISSERFKSIQKEMTPKHRGTAVKWIVQLNYKFGWSSDTLYHAVACFDLVSSNISIPKSEIQVYAVVCHALSAKMDMRLKVPIDQININTGESFTAEQFALKEREILDLLSYRLVYPTSKLYLRWYLNFFSSDQQMFELTNFFAEIALMKFEFMDWKPSIIGLSVFILSLGCTGKIEVAAKAMSISECKDREAVSQCVALMKVHGRRIVDLWNDPGMESKNRDVREFFAHINLDCDLEAVIRG